MAADNSLSHVLSALDQMREMAISTWGTLPEPRRRATLVAMSNVVLLLAKVTPSRGEA